MSIETLSKIEEYEVTCPKCKGLGVVYDVFRANKKWNKPMYGLYQCPMCKGKGLIRNEVRR